MLQAWAQLVRLPNVFTAPADVIAGAALSYHLIDGSPSLPNIILLCLVSICYYAGGMILNDVADIEVDRRERPDRPLPSGRICLWTATYAGLGLLLLGIVIGLALLPEAKTTSEGCPILALPILIIAYNFFLKNTHVGPLNMGLCRGCNLLLGTILVTELNYGCYIAAIVAVLYIQGVTTIAYDETRQQSRWRMILGLFLITFSMILLLNETFSFQLKVTPGYVYLAVLLVSLFCLLQLMLWVPAYQHATPPLVGRAIKYSILGLIVIDTIHSVLGYGYPGLAVLLFLIPALFLGRFIYST